VGIIPFGEQSVIQGVFEYALWAKSLGFKLLENKIQILRRFAPQNDMKKDDSKLLEGYAVNI
jgi:hypothetical protein